MFKNASAVVTTSFHGTCFSIIYEKQFVTVTNTKDKRIPAILDEMGLGTLCRTEFTKWPQGPDFKIAREVVARKKSGNR